MDLHTVDTANVFVYYRYLKKARSALAHCVHGSVAHPVDGIFIVQLNCPRTLMLLLLKTLSATVGRRSNGVTAEFSSRDGANASWVNYMLKDRQQSEFDDFLDCIIIKSLHNPIADA